VVRVKFKDKKQFESCWVKDISNGGIFLRTQTPAALFGKLNVVIELPGGDTVDLQGEVVRVVLPEHAGPGVSAGMGVQFTDLNREKRAALESYLGLTVVGPQRRADSPTVAEVAAPPRAAGLEDMAQMMRRLLWLCADADVLARCDYFEVLGLEPLASNGDVREVCGVLRALLDPGGLPDGVKGGDDRFRRLQLVIDDIEATLCDPRRRAAHAQAHGRR
jgi:uncharacterized protein (TIGR02266 family)